jgi:hypothetical protein
VQPTWPVAHLSWGSSCLERGRFGVDRRCEAGAGTGIAQLIVICRRGGPSGGAAFAVLLVGVAVGSGAGECPPAGAAGGGSGDRAARRRGAGDRRQRGRKDGTKTAHVGHQWLGRYGKTDSGVVTVTTLWADERLYYPVHAVPYTPASPRKSAPTGAARWDRRTVSRPGRSRGRPAPPRCPRRGRTARYASVQLTWPGRAGPPIIRPPGHRPSWLRRAVPAAVRPRGVAVRRERCTPHGRRSRRTSGPLAEGVSPARPSSAQSGRDGA